MYTVICGVVQVSVQGSLRIHESTHMLCCWVHKEKHYYHSCTGLSLTLDMQGKRILMQNINTYSDCAYLEHPLNAFVLPSVLAASYHPSVRRTYTVLTWAWGD
jgi:hypothetical protein